MCVQRRQFLTETYREKVRRDLERRERESRGGESQVVDGCAVEEKK